MNDQEPPSKFKYVPQDRAAGIEQIEQKLNNLTNPTTSDWSPDQLNKLTDGKVEDYPEPEFLDIRATTITLNALMSLGLLDKDTAQLYLSQGLNAALTNLVVKDRVVQQVGAFANKGNSQILTSASVADLLK